MSAIEIKMIIDQLIDFAYDHTVERVNAIEDAPEDAIYRFLAVERNNPSSYTFAFMNYYMGVFEGIFFTRFLEELNRMPTPSENSFIKDSFANRFEEFKSIAIRLAKKAHDKDNS